MKERVMIVYSATSKTTGRSYVGQTSRRLVDRVNDHVRKARQLKRAFYAELSEHGKDSFEWKVLDVCSSRDEVNSRETFWIKELKTQDPATGFNKLLANTGDMPTTQAETLSRYRMGKRHSAETIATISANRTGKSPKTRPPFSDEWKRNLSIGQRRKIRLVRNETGQVFGSQAEAVQFCGLNKSALSAHLLGKRKSARKGFTFRIEEK